MNTYSQFAEDEKIAAIFDRIGIENRWCFEVGAHDGRYFSNTLAFRELGWTAILAECHDDHFATLHKEFGKASFCVHQKVESLDRLLSETEAPQNIDLGVIDVDGEDYWLWCEMVKYRPRVLMIEFSPYTNQASHDPLWAIPRGAQGQTARAPMLELGQSKGYRLEHETFCNLIFVDGESK